MCRWLRLVPGPPSRSSLGRSELAEQLVQVLMVEVEHDAPRFVFPAQDEGREQEDGVAGRLAAHPEAPRRPHECVQVIQWHLADVGQLQAVASDGLEELSAAWQSRQQCLRGHGGRRVRVEAHEDAGEQARQRRTVEVVAGALKALEEIADIGSDTGHRQLLARRGQSRLARRLSRGIAAWSWRRSGGVYSSASPVTMASTTAFSRLMSRSRPAPVIATATRRRSWWPPVLSTRDLRSSSRTTPAIACEVTPSPAASALGEVGPSRSRCTRMPSSMKLAALSRSVAYSCRSRRATRPIATLRSCAARTSGPSLIYVR